MEFSYTLNELPEVAKKILSIEGPNTLLFYGKMGVGKTTLIKELCQQLQVDDLASSPSFGIVNEYHSPHGPIYHFDFYRIEDPEEAQDLGVDEYFYNGYKVFVEWPEKIAEYLPENAMKITIETEKDGKRKLRIS